MNKKLSNESDWFYEISFSNTDPNIIISKIIDVIEAIDIKSSWPTEDEWKAILPTWFLSSFVELTQEEAKALMLSTPKDQWHKLPWHFGSWLEAIQLRGWKWHGYQLEEGKLKLNLTIIEWPANLQAFEWIVKVAGGDLIKGGFIDTTK